jgi:CubicO group peptidase (beta-lactamase class C family)
MKTNPPRFINAQSNSWKLVPDREFRYSDKGVGAAHEAESLLRRGIEEHPATSWAQLAQRELETPLGFKWVETYAPPQPRNRENEDAKRKISTVNEARPPEVPKLYLTQK